MLTGDGLPRWLRTAALVGAAALLAGYLGTHLPGHAGQRDARSPAKVLPAPRYGADTVLDVARGPDGTWLLKGTSLAEVDGTRVVRSVRTGRLGLRLDGVPRLVVDTARNRVWIVVTDAAAARLVAYDADTLHKVFDATWHQVVQGGLAYRGHLYLATSLGVADLAPGATQPHLVPGLGKAVGPIALDATRNRLVAIDLGYPTHVWTYRPGRAPVEARQLLRLSGGTLAVVAGTIWVGGFTDSTAVLERLDPTTLRPVRRAPVELYGPGAVITGAGESVLWVRPGNGTRVLACVADTDGAVRQRWPLAAVRAVASGRDGALAVTPDGVLGLVLSGCAG